MLQDCFTPNSLVSLEIVTLNDLQKIRNEEGKDFNFYLILTYHTHFDLVHYPLPLTLQEYDIQYVILY